MNLRFVRATVADVPALARLHGAAAQDLTERFGQGPWSNATSENGMLFALRNSTAFLALDGREVVATLRLASKKPWAINPLHFTPCSRPLYLIGMAVSPGHQRLGVGRWCLDQAKLVADSWDVHAIRLDAYDAKAGAGGFYSKCGYTERGRVTYRGTPLIYYELLLR